MLSAAAVCTRSMTPHLHTLKSISLSDANTQTHIIYFVTHTSAVSNSKFLPNLQFHVLLPCSGHWDRSEVTLTYTVSKAVQDVSLFAQTLKAARVVDAGVVTGSLKGALVNV